MDMPVILATRDQRSAEQRSSRRGAEGRFAAQASKEPLHGPQDGSSCSTVVKTFRLRAKRA